MDAQFAFSPNIANEIEVPNGGILTKPFFENEFIKIVLFGMDAGQVLSEHTATKPALLHFLEGEAEITLGDAEQIAKPQTWIYMQPNLPHSVKAKTKLKMVLQLIKSPKK